MKSLREAYELHDCLNPVIWYEDGRIKEDVLDILSNVATEFLEYIDIPLNVVDIEIVGSNASYNYNEQSDLDLHFIVNFDTNYVDDTVLQQLYNSKKNSFNDKYNINIENVPVELYIEDIKSSNATNGRYSILKNEWVKFPEPIQYDLPDINEELNYYLSRVDSVMVGNNSDEIQELIDEIYMMRKLGLEQDGEASVGNLVFKELRNRDVMSKLRDRYYELRSNEICSNGDDNKMENVNESRAKLAEASYSRLYQHLKDENTFAMIGSEDMTTGEDRSDELISSLVGLRDKDGKMLGYNPLFGVYSYADGTNTKAKPETSLIVYGIQKEDALRLCDKLNQESIIFKDEEGNLESFDRNGNKLDTFGNMENPMTFDKAVTRIAGSRFKHANKNQQKYFAFTMNEGKEQPRLESYQLRYLQPLNGVKQDLDTDSYTICEVRAKGVQE